jgi:hypothetical protein
MVVWWYGGMVVWCQLVHGGFKTQMLPQILPEAALLVSTRAELRWGWYSQRTVVPTGTVMLRTDTSPPGCRQPCSSTRAPAGSTTSLSGPTEANTVSHSKKPDVSCALMGHGMGHAG